MTEIRFKQFAALFAPALSWPACAAMARAMIVAVSFYAALSGLLAVGGYSLVNAQAPAVGNAALYEIRGVDVDVTDESAAAAKIKAILEAQQKAFAILLERLLGDAIKSDPPEIPPGEIARVMGGLSIEKEFSSARQYIATLSIRFRPEAVQQLLEAHNLSSSAKQAPTVLLLAVYKIGPRAVLWESPNPWRDAWTALGPENSLTPILLPLGDLTDSDTVTAQDVLAGNTEKFEILKQRYRVEHVLVSIAEADASRTKLTASLKGDSPSGMLNWKDEFSGKAGEIEVTAKNAAKRFLAAIENKWRAEGPQTPASGGVTYTVTVPFSGLGEWQEIRQRIQQVFGVSSVDTKTLSGQGAIVDILFDGSLGQLTRELEGRGLILADSGETLVLYRD